MLDLISYLINWQLGVHSCVTVTAVQNIMYIVNFQGENIFNIVLRCDLNKMTGEVPLSPICFAPTFQGSSVDIH